MTKTFTIFYELDDFSNIKEQIFNSDEIFPQEENNELFNLLNLVGYEPDERVINNIMSYIR